MRTKIIYSDDGTLSDWTPNLQNYYSGTEAATFVAAEDAIYIGSVYPFTSQYFKQSSVNVSASTITVSYWDGSTWRSMADVIDHTGLSGTPFSSSGLIEFYTDKRYDWVADDTVINGTTQITGLGNITVYDMYWIKITYDNDIAMTLSWSGELFCEDADLGGVAPAVLVSEFMTDWESGKSDWEEQRYAASKLVIDELKAIKLDDQNLYLDRNELKLSTIYRTLMIIYEEMDDESKYALYERRFNSLLKRSFSKDTNLNGRQDADEVGKKYTTMRR